MTTTISSPIFILRKTPYAAKGLIVSGLTPEHGLVQLFLSKARGIKVGLQGHIDIFQLMLVEFCPHKNDPQHLVRPQLLEMMSQYPDLPKRYSCFVTASKIAKFILSHLSDDIARPKLFRALLVAMERLADLGIEEAIANSAALGGFLLILLSEEGLLPDYPQPETQKRIESLIKLALNSKINPNCLSLEVWQNVVTWLIDLLRQNDFNWD